MEWTKHIQSFVGLLAVVDPFGAIPVYLLLTQRMVKMDRRRALGATVLCLMAVLLGALLAGNTLLHVFGIGLPTLRIAGGLLILTVAYPMLRGKPPESGADSEDPRAVGVVPLGIPLLGGPGAISTVVVLSRENAGIAEWGVLVLIILLVSACVYVSLRLAPALSICLGKTGLSVLSRVMGLLLAALALEFIVAGLLKVFPGLGA